MPGSIASDSATLRGCHEEVGYHPGSACTGESTKHNW